VLLPLAVGLAYSAASTLFERTPALADMVPADAIEVQRYRDLAAYDAMHPAPEAPGKVAPQASHRQGSMPSARFQGGRGVQSRRTSLLPHCPH